MPHRGRAQPGGARRQDRGRAAGARASSGYAWLAICDCCRKELIRAFPQRILNIHPSLLPAFPGLEAQRQALEYGVAISGCTVHLVDEELDHGPVVVQRAVAVEDDDSVDTLSARILEQEHQAYPEALRRLLTRPWRLEGRRLLFSGAAALGRNRDRSVP